MNCDFCGCETTTEELMVIPTKTFEIPELSFRNESWAWGACPDCAVDWFSSDMESLLGRAVDRHPSGEAIRNVLDVVYLAVRLNQTGPMRHWQPSDERKP